MVLASAAQAACSLSRHRAYWMFMLTVNPWGKGSGLSTQMVFRSPPVTRLVTTPGRLPGRVLPTIAHAPATRLVMSAQAPLVTYSWRLKSALGQFSATVAVPLRDIVTSDRWTPTSPLLAAGTMFVVGTGLGGLEGAGMSGCGAVGLLCCSQPMLVAITAMSKAIVVIRVKGVFVTKANPVSVL
jgi:hypothetical protein